VKIARSRVEGEGRPHINAAFLLLAVAIASSVLLHYLRRAAGGSHLHEKGRFALAEIRTVRDSRLLFWHAYDIRYSFRDRAGRPREGVTLTTVMPHRIGDKIIPVFYDRSDSVSAGADPPGLPGWLVTALSMPLVAGLILCGAERVRRIQRVLSHGEPRTAEVRAVRRMWHRMLWVHPPTRVTLRYSAGRGTRTCSVVTHLAHRMKPGDRVTLMRRGRHFALLELYRKDEDDC